MSNSKYEATFHGGRSVADALNLAKPGWDAVQEPNLPMATTRQLLDELRRRAEHNGPENGWAAVAVFCDLTTENLEADGRLDFNLVDK